MGIFTFHKEGREEEQGKILVSDLRAGGTKVDTGREIEVQATRKERGLTTAEVDELKGTAISDKNGKSLIPRHCQEGYIDGAGEGLQMKGTQGTEVNENIFSSKSAEILGFEGGKLKERNYTDLLRLALKTKSEENLLSCAKIGKKLGFLTPEVLKTQVFPNIDSWPELLVTSLEEAALESSPSLLSLLSI